MIGAGAMSMEGLRWAWPIALPVSGKVTLARLADMANPSGTCFPSVARLATDTGLSLRGVQMAIADLERRNLIRRVGRHDSGSTVYRLNTELSAAAQPVRTCAVSAQRGECAPAHSVPNGGAVSAHRTPIEPKEERTVLRTDAASAASPPANPRKAIWTEGLKIIQMITGKPAGAARSLMGRLLKLADDDCAGLMTAIRECPESRDPVSWLMAAAKARGSTKMSAMDRIRQDWRLPSLIDTSFMNGDDDTQNRLILQ